MLRAFSALLRGAIRNGVDWVARYGGEEFVIVLPETDLAGATVVAEKLRAATGALAIAHGGASMRITASFGVATAPAGWDGAGTADALLAQADVCLYQSKQDGRDRLTTAALAR